MGPGLQKTRARPSKNKGPAFQKTKGYVENLLEIKAGARPLKNKETGLQKTEGQAFKKQGAKLIQNRGQVFKT